MSLKKEDLGKNSFKLTIEVSAEEFEKACERSYQKNKGKIQLQGFRKGKAPRALIEKAYGAGVFFEDAANELIENEYPKAAEESGLEIVSRPEIDVEQIEKGKSFIFTAVVAVKPEVELGQYKGVKVDKIPVEVSDDEINAEIDKVRDQNSRTITVDDRAVEKDDIVNLNYEGSVDGVPFEGGKADNYDLTIGSGSFIPGFEDQLVGAAIGADVDVNVTFPKEYHAAELAGKAAVFKCHINSISKKELPAADDEFAQEVSDFDTIADYKADVKAKLIEKKEKEVKAAKENAVIEAIIESSKMDIPAAMLDTQKRQLAEDFAQRLQYQGLSLDQYFQFTGLTAEKFLEQLEPQALQRIQSRLVLEAIVKAENIEVSDEEVEKEFENMASQYQMEVSKIKELIGEAEKKNIVMDLAVEKAINLVTDAAKETAPKAAKAAKEPKAEKETKEAAPKAKKTTKAAKEAKED